MGLTQEAERQLRKAEKAAKKEEQRRRGVGWFGRTCWTSLELCLGLGF